MNYTLINITSFFLEIIKGRQIVLTSLCGLFLILLNSGCVTKETKNESLYVNKEINALKVNKNLLKLNPLEGKWYYNGKPYSGYSVTYHSNGVLLSSIGYYEGKKEGIAREWFENGVLKKESFFIENRLNGSVKSWWPNKKLSSESYYVNGVREGIQKRWFDNGQLSRQTTLKNGIEEGMQQAWLRNGKIYVNYEAKNGRIFGLKKANLCYKLKNEIVQN
nr:hypothetical protein [uncultured Psychroserpens sp.]